MITLYKQIKLWGGAVLLLMVIALSYSTKINANSLEDFGYSSLPGNKTQLVLTFSDTIKQPNSFSIEDPARLVLDFTDIKNKLSQKEQTIDIGAVRSIAVAESGNRTRLVVNLSQNVPYIIEHYENIITVTIDNATSIGNNEVARDKKVESIDFRRGEKGEGRLIVAFNHEGITVDVMQQRDTVLVDLIGVTLPENLHRRLDVTDFATPVQAVDSEYKGSNPRLILSNEGRFEHLAYQSGKTLVVEVKPIVKTDLQEENEVGFRGEKLSLNFQNIEVRAVLQLLAEFTGLNLVTSDTVQGSVTLRLKNVPWDQAMDIILKTKGLSMRQSGNVMLIAPAAEMAAREKQELEAQKQLVELEPIYSEIIEINFAKATEILEILKMDEGQNVTTFLSSRGSVSVDQRTNSLLIRDTADNIKQLKKVVEKLDVPIRQVLIESRIVIANNDFTKELGARFGVSSDGRNNAVSGSLNNISIANDSVTSGAALNTANDSLNVNLPIANPAGVLALALAKLPLGTLLALELSAMQAEGKGEIISTPRVVTANQQTAVIEQGTEIPYQEASSSGATSVSFKEAVLKLEVTPQITPDDHIIMELEVHKDEVGTVFNNVPSIDTRSIRTQVVVDNGETVVLGGIYEQSNVQTTSRVPFFGDLPVVGAAFRSTSDVNTKRELLVFVTPKIIKESLNF
ncbi:MAG TPA: type IV pilus secretin PilQ [Gammaproteobacteria bacterium]|nr:type IV pilus secretin PilQ [Gammaproteobacteria bacterium]